MGGTPSPGGAGRKVLVQRESPAGERERLLKAKLQQNMQRYGPAPVVKIPEEVEKDEDEESARSAGSVLVGAFMAMLVIGTGNRIFMRLQTYPMYNYPFFLNLLSVFIYIPACFAYIIPMQMWGNAITPQQLAIPRHKFAIMGGLDALAGIMTTFSVNYLTNASMIVLLQQAAIPISMAISKAFLKASYTWSQYAGASVVVAGIIVTMIPNFVHGEGEGDGAQASVQIVWSIVQVLSCIPMCLSSVYKEKALGEADIDVIYLNGQVAVYQFLAALLFALPSAWALNLPIEDLPSNMWDGWLCFLGKDSILPSMAAGIDTHPLDHCSAAPYYVSIYFFFNILYNILLIVILKYGSANVLWLASTVMVPIGNLAFSLKFVPGNQPIKESDLWGLAVILGGLVLYRFSGPAVAWLHRLHSRKSFQEEEDVMVRREGMIERRVTSSNRLFVGLNQAEFLEPIIETRVWRAQRARLQKTDTQIRGDLLLRLGIPPSPLVSVSPATALMIPRGPGREWGSPGHNTPSGGGSMSTKMPVVMRKMSAPSRLRPGPSPGELQRKALHEEQV